MATRSVIDAEWLQAHLEDPSIAIVDVRPPQFYMQGHIPGAVNLPGFFLAGPDGDAPPAPAFAARLGALGVRRDTHVIAYDDGASPSAARLYWVLRSFGHPAVSVLDGGITTWRHEGRDWEYTPVRAIPAEYETPRKRESTAVGLDEMRGKLGDDASVIVDVRSPGEYLGTRIAAGRGGHIPGAVNIDWTNNLAQTEDEIPLLRTDEELKELYAAAGVTPEKDVIVYCQSGGRASETFMVLDKLGYPKVSIYVPGWQEWGNRGDTPVET